jgi:hypothetical protein
MPESLIRRAYNATSFFSISKGLGAVGLSALVLLWNWWFGLRSWDATKTFFLCLLLGYASLALIALVWNLSILGAKDWWITFIGGLRMNVSDAIKQATAQALQNRSAPTQRPQHPLFRDTELIKLGAFLKSKGKGEVRLVSQTGEPQSYEQARIIDPIFRECGWKVSLGMAELNGPGIFVFATSRTPEKTNSLVCEALSASGIRFTHREVESNDFDICTIYFSHRPY